MVKISVIMIKLGTHYPCSRAVVVTIHQCIQHGPRTRCSPFTGGHGYIYTV